ncbi:MAG: SPOR domain-containing protein [Bacteroidaceae bacterium]|nr:SPOR domain-containing protein [Bacteroidaceae bacterium]
MNKKNKTYWKKFLHFREKIPIFALVNDLSKHIEYLLLSNDCLIVPQLGAFVVRHMNSEWSEEEEIFLPPYRQVHFNEKIRHNDNLLASSLIHFHKISFEEALKWIDEYVKLINEELLVNGSFDMGSIGVLYKENDSSPISFSACKAGVTAPELYGLDTFQASYLPDVLLKTVDTTIENTQRIAAIEKDKNHITIRLNRKVFNVVTTIAASIVLFFMFSTPVQNTSMTTDLSSNKEIFFPKNLIPHQATSQTEKKSTIETERSFGPTINVEEKTLETNLTEETTSTTENHVEKESAEHAKSEISHGKYCIVMSSAVSQKNAERYTEYLRKAGYNAEIFDNGKIRRVIIGGFQTEESCREQIKEMHKNKEYKDCWFMKLN